MNGKITKKIVKEAYKNIISVGYCELQSLLRFKGAKFYNYGVYGWNCDIYVIDYDTVIVTGYRPFGNIKPTHELMKKYENKAKKILEKNNNYSIREKELDNLINKFIKEVLDYGNNNK